MNHGEVGYSLYVLKDGRYKPMEYSVGENADLHLGQVGQIMV